MKNNSNVKFWVIIVVVAIVAAIVGSVANSITGNVVSVQNNGYSKCISDCQRDCSKLSLKDRPECRSKCTDSCSLREEVYTKAEIDIKLNDVYNKEDIEKILDRFTTVTISSADTNYANSNSTCSDICNSWTRTKYDVQFSSPQSCLWMAISGEEKNEYNATSSDVRMFDANNGCNLPISAYLTQGWKYITCFCG